MNISNEDFKYLNKQLETLVQLRQSGYKCDKEIGQVLGSLHEKMGLEKKVIINASGNIVANGDLFYNSKTVDTEYRTCIGKNQYKRKLLILCEQRVDLLYHFFKEFVIPKATVLETSSYQDEAAIETETCKILFKKKATSTRGMQYDYMLSM
ncbi:hypothetical protein GXP75_14910 [Bacillus sp. HU-1818]|uniref:hypothetical protein n=1 Tax=Bacillus sp. HU-1818 TaxID=2704469 RepID=UPI001F5E1298|nr:hypothetical protein [Bacillus sp. HU-1818]